MIYVFTAIAEPEANEYETADVEMTVRAENFGELVDCFNRFALACSFANQVEIKDADE